MKVAPQTSSNEDAGFFASAGTTLATWGLGSILLLVQFFSESQARLLFPLLAPIATVSLLVSLFARNAAKREDSSHIHCLALAGAMAPFDLGAGFFYGIAASLVVVNAANFRCPRNFAPVGPTIMFVAVLAPGGGGPLAVAVLCSAILGITARTGRSEGIVAVSVFPLLASLYLCARNIDGTSPVLAILATAHVALVVWLRSRRTRQGIQSTERRILLDGIVVGCALTLLVESLTPMATHVRYLVVALVFSCLASFTSRPASAWIANRFPPFAAVLPPDARMQTVPAFSVAATIWMAAAVVDWPMTFGLVYERSARVAGIVGLGMLLFRLGARSGSFVQRDWTKLLFLFASLLAWWTLRSTNLTAASAGAVATLGVMQYVAIALTVTAAGLDLGRKHEGAWQGIFSGRALAKIRRTRGKVFDILSQAPMVGWMFHLGDRAASNLHGTFGGAKTWTISHYAICIAISLGALSLNILAVEYFVYRDPTLGARLIEASTPDSVRQGLGKSFAGLVSLIAYSALVFLAGSVLQLLYLRTLSFTLACFMLVVLAFQRLGSEGVALSLLFYPLAFCCLMAMFRILHRSKGPDGPPSTGNLVRDEPAGHATSAATLVGKGFSAQPRIAEPGN